MTTPNTLQRREFKYLISEHQADQLRRYIEGICTVDPYAAHTGGRYLIDTLYLDTPWLGIYFATIENAPDRYKLRIRNYPSLGGGPVFFEVKRRINETIIKTRAHFRGEWAHMLVDASPETLAGIDPKQRKGVDNFICYFHRGPMLPQAIVRYEREPYFSTIDDYARVTFDRNVSYQRVSELTLSPDTDHWTLMDDPLSQRGLGLEGSAVLLELKFTNVVPSWMRNMVHTFALQRLAFCKYTRAIDSMRIVPSERVARAGFRS
ncbi:MAG: polyphosphate polymerase domain-containing protein [Deltaproteobacteria bacterium]|nr:polyphosphate polymerase domain-containing protein [Deltaproteobacteria bacterium]